MTCQVLLSILKGEGFETLGDTSDLYTTIIAGQLRTSVLDFLHSRDSGLQKSMSFPLEQACWLLSMPGWALHLVYRIFQLLLVSWSWKSQWSPVVKSRRDIRYQFWWPSFVKRPKWFKKATLQSHTACRLQRGLFGAATDWSYALTSYVVEIRQSESIMFLNLWICESSDKNGYIIFTHISTNLVVFRISLGLRNRPNIGSHGPH